jgi:hypothetical protein
MAIYLDGDGLTFDFSAYHADARLSIEFQRTLRIPDDGKEYPLPPGLGRFPVRHVEDYESRLPESWLRRGGVLLPMYQAEAMWVRFQAGSYPIAVKIAAGKINAVTGEPWRLGLNRDPQDYMVTPGQPWLDGFCVEKGIVRQFVAMPLGKGYTAEEQLTGHAAWGGLQIVAYPIKKELYVRKPAYGLLRCETLELTARLSAPMGLAPGGRMHQEIYEDGRQLSDWDQRTGERCFIGILNSEDWHAVTGEPIPRPPLSAKDYAAAGLPWFDYYGDQPAVGGSAALARLKAIGDFSPKDGLDDDVHDTVPVTRVIKLGPRRGEVRVGEF